MMNGWLKTAAKISLTLGLMVALAFGVSLALTDPTIGRDRTSRPRSVQRSGNVKQGQKAWNTREDGSPMLYGDGWFDDSGYFFAVRFNSAVADSTSLDQIGTALSGRGRRGIDFLRKVLADTPRDAPTSATQICQLHLSIGGLHMYEGDFAAAADAFNAGRDALGKVDDLTWANYEALLGIVALRRGEVENCVACCNEDSCIFPLGDAAVHRNTGGSREAVRRFTAYLEKRPEDLGVRWLLNVAAMTLGEYPDKVPPRYLIPLEPFQSQVDLGRFPNVAARLGLDPGGNMAGGSVLDDFNGDGLIDVFTSTANPARGRACSSTAETVRSKIIPRKPAWRAKWPRSIATKPTTIMMVTSMFT